MIAAVGPTKRLASLDVLRGLTVAGMILANNPGDYEYVYPKLGHAAWHGWTPVDLIFPLFLFMVGVSLALSLAPASERAAGSPSPLARVLRRAALLFALGLFYNAFPFLDVDWPSLRIMGVLQRIALVYLLAACLRLYLRPRALPWLIAGILLGYWALMALVPVPSLGHPSLARETNLVAWLDQKILRGHLWDFETPWDPEGILSTLPALCLALLGLLAGAALKRGGPKGLRGLLAWGAALFLGGLIWDRWFPINKGLATSSFVIFAGGAALFGLAACHWLVDVRGRTAITSPFISLGMNPLAIYLFSELLEKVLYAISLADPAGEPITLHQFLYQRLFASWLSPFHASVAWAVLFLLVQVLLAGLLRARRIFIKL